MSKRIIIIGGGISGLALLHYLQRKHSGTGKADICLLERNVCLGGTICSQTQAGCLFETGPNGFLDSKPRTLDLITDIGLGDRVLKARQESKIRYLSVRNTLHRLPSGPKEFLTFPLLNPLEKLRVVSEMFLPGKPDPDETVYAFGQRRFGEKFAQVFLDPMVSGIYGGDARQANLKAVFPRIYALEEKYGSLFKAMMKIRKSRAGKGKNGTPSNQPTGSPGGTLTSFPGGMTEMVSALGERYAQSIRFNQEVTAVCRTEKGMRVVTHDKTEYPADEIFICAPAYGAAEMLRSLNSRLAEALETIRYTPIAVVGLVCPTEYFNVKPEGYGYLIPSSENKEVLGVLFESNIFPGRCREKEMLFRVMIGGARHPRILEKPKEDLIRLAVAEIQNLQGDGTQKSQTASPKEMFYKPWAKAIPQYDQVYCGALTVIEKELLLLPNIHLVANYLKGVSLNDCIESAYQNSRNCMAGEEIRL